MPSNLVALLLTTLALGSVPQLQAQECPDGTLVILESGTDDNFALPIEPTDPDSILRTYFSNLTQRWFDQPGVNMVTLHTFAWRPAPVQWAILEARVRAEGDFSQNDRFSIKLRDAVVTEGGEVWRWTLPMETLTGGEWSTGVTADLVLNLGDLPVDLFGRTSVLGHLADGNVDIWVDDDSVADYFQLTICLGDPTSTRPISWGVIKSRFDSPGPPPSGIDVVP